MPYAHDPTQAFTMWFHPQAVYVGRYGDRTDSWSICSDIRALSSGKALLAQANNYARIRGWIY